MDNAKQFVEFFKKYLISKQNELLNLLINPNTSKVEDFRFCSGQINTALWISNILDMGLKSFQNGDPELTLPKPDESTPIPAPYSDSTETPSQAGY